MFTFIYLFIILSGFAGFRKSVIIKMGNCNDDVFYRDDICIVFYIIIFSFRCIVITIRAFLLLYIVALWLLYTVATNAI